MKENELYLTETEIYEIDELSELDFVEYLLTHPEEKRDLILHIYAKNRGLRTLKVLWDEGNAGIERLCKILDEHGIEYV